MHQQQRISQIFDPWFRFRSWIVGVAVRNCPVGPRRHRQHQIAHLWKMSSNQRAKIIETVRLTEVDIRLNQTGLHQFFGRLLAMIGRTFPFGWHRFQTESRDTTIVVCHGNPAEHRLP
jgi:hypothetical protein